MALVAIQPGNLRGNRVRVEIPVEGDGLEITTTSVTPMGIQIHQHHKIAREPGRYLFGTIVSSKESPVIVVQWDGRRHRTSVLKTPPLPPEDEELLPEYEDN